MTATHEASRKPCLVASTLAAVSLTLLAVGCHASRSTKAKAPVFPISAAASVAENAEPNAETPSIGSRIAQTSFEQIPNVADQQPDTASTPRPITGRSTVPDDFWELTLTDAIAIALQDTKVLRSLSANAVQNPQFASGSLDPAIQYTDPNFGVQSALAEFDTSLRSTALYSNNDQTFNNPSTTGNAVEVQEDITNFTLELNRFSQFGTQYRIGQNIVHSASNNRALLFSHAWNTSLEATVRHPLLQGSGVLFNQIAGPRGQTGLFQQNGFLISRSNHKISLAQFENDVRRMVLEIARAYWQLDLAYQNYETLKAARDGSKQTWNVVKARRKNGLPGGEADREAQARSQYYQFERRLKESLFGRQVGGSTSVLQAEADLRRLVGLPQSDGVLIRPSETPTAAESVFSWPELTSRAISSRVELRQQRLRIKQSSWLLFAAKNFTQPRLDAIATYRNNGFGDDLINNAGKFAGAFNEGWAGNYGEWEFGLTMDVPLGFRQANAGVRNAELKLTRDRAVLREQKQQILHDLGSALRDVDQSYQSIELAELQTNASREALLARQAAYKADAVGFEDLLQSQQQLLDSQLDLHQSATQHELAIMQLHFESGQLLSQFGIELSTCPRTIGQQSVARANPRKILH